MSGPDHAARGFDAGAADRFLAAADPVLARWMARVPPPQRSVPASFNPVAALARSIIYQQLSGKAAATIAARVEALMLRPGYITVAGLDAASDDALCAAGISPQKLAALRDLADKARAGIVPDHRRLARMDNQSIIDQLTQVRGVGRWTVEMLLMFRLGRPDILPHDDLGIRKGARILWQLDDLPKPRKLAEAGEVWAPWRTRASAWLWAIVDFGQGGPKVRRSQE